MVHSSCSGSTLSSASSPSSGFTTEFKVYGSLFKVSSRYQLLHALGKGSYGIVCAAKDRETGQCVAIKKVTPMARRTADAKHTLREVLLLQHLGKHPNVISIHNLAANFKDDELYMIMDLMDTDMHRVIQSSQPLSGAHVRYFVHQLLRGVKYLHDNGVLHRDLKPGNLLLSKNCTLKIADFGLARKIPRRVGKSGTFLARPRSAPAASFQPKGLDRPPMTEHVVTRWYRAPELMLQPDGLYDQSVDMWSVGCIFAELLGRKPLFPGKNFLHQLTLIFNIIGTPSPDAIVRLQSSQAQCFLQSMGRKSKRSFRTLFPTANEAAVDLLERMLEFDPIKRISAQEALEHPYMQEMEQKYRHRSGDDPLPCTRADFSFDLKNLTKMDLRALIVNEVEHHRKLRSNGATGFVETGTDGDLHTVSDKNRSLSTLTSPHFATISISRAHEIKRLDKEPQDERKGKGVVKLGANRPRIRIQSKPRIPKQQKADRCVSNQLEQVQVFHSQARLLSNSISSCAAKKDVNRDIKPENVTTQSQNQYTLIDKCKRDNRTHVSTKSATFKRPNLSHELYPEESGPDVSATTSALTKSSNAKIAAAAIDGQTSLSLQQAQAWQTNESENPEHLRMLASSRQDAKRCPEGNRIFRPESAMVLNQAKKTKFDAKETTRIATQRSRQVSSARITRSNSLLPPPATRNAGTRKAYVGSINSLIQAQRLYNGESLADLADTMLATITQKEEWVEATGEGLEASSMKLLQEKAMTNRKTEGMEKRLCGKKLTVPKSPNFSIMSWQKKHDDFGRRVGVKEDI